MLVVWMLFYAIANSAIEAIQVGIIRNASLVVSELSEEIAAATCDECLCMIFNSTCNGSIVSFNCYASSTQSVVCEMFTQNAYLAASFVRMETNTSSRFYFRQLPQLSKANPAAVTTGINVY